MRQWPMRYSLTQANDRNNAKENQSNESNRATELLISETDNWYYNCGKKGNGE